MNRSLLPAAIAQMVADTTGELYDAVAMALGRAAERLLTDALESLPDLDDDLRFPEAAMPASMSKADYLIEHGDVLVGIDFTLLTPTRALASGATDAVDKLVTRVSNKFAQIPGLPAWRESRSGLPGPGRARPGWGQCPLTV